MDTARILSLTVLFVLAVGGWLISYRRHRHCSTFSEDAIQCPAIICWLLGSFRADRVLSVPGMALQLFIYVMAPIYALFIFERVTYDTLVFSLRGTIILLLAIAVIHYFVKPKRG
jgi:hypothetical protein